jgi:hypothetical protein
MALRLHAAFGVGERRIIPRTKLKVIHRHRIGAQRFRRVSELVFVRGKPRAMLEWLNLGGVRSPLYIAELDPAKLRKAKHLHNTYYYDAETEDPRYIDAAPSPTT